MSVTLGRQLLSLSADELLDEFGAGKPVPGAGSAAALLGILACKLCLTVIKLTKQKDSYEANWSQVSSIESQIVGRVEPKLYQVFQKDSEVFAEVVLARQKRELELNSEKREQLDFEELLSLREATELQLEVCETCDEICEFAISLFDLGYQTARGDSGTAMSGALSGAMSALSICYLNLRKFTDDEWASTIRMKCDDLLQRLERLKRKSFLIITKLREEAIQPMFELKSEARAFLRLEESPILLETRLNLLRVQKNYPELDFEEREFLWQGWCQERENNLAKEEARFRDEVISEQAWERRIGDWMAQKERQKIQMPLFPE